MSLEQKLKDNFSFKENFSPKELLVLLSENNIHDIDRLIEVVMKNYKGTNLSYLQPAWIKDYHNRNWKQISLYFEQEEESLSYLNKILQIGCS